MKKNVYVFIEKGDARLGRDVGTLNSLCGIIVAVIKTLKPSGVIRWRVCVGRVIVSRNFGYFDSWMEQMG